MSLRLRGEVKNGNMHQRVLRIQMIFVALGMNNEELREGEGGPNLMINNPSTPVIRS